MNSPETKAGLMAGVPQISIQKLQPKLGPLVLPDGVYVPVGKRPDGLMAIGQAMTKGGISERKIPDGQTTEGVILGEMMDWGISPITGKNLNTEHVNNCHVLAGVGIATDSKNPYEQRGLLAHINPAARLLKTNGLERNLRERVLALRDQTHQYTRDLFIAGGAIDIVNKTRADWTTGLCIDSIEMIAGQCSDMDVEPTVTLPLLEPLDNGMALETQNRTLQIRPSGTYRYAELEKHFPTTFPASKAREVITSLRQALHWKM